MNHTDITPHIIPRRQWLVAYVQSCLEKKTAERLKTMGVEYYLPIQSEIRQWSDRRKKVDRLVIPMMIFVHVTPQERPLPLHRCPPFMANRLLLPWGHRFAL